MMRNLLAGGFNGPVMPVTPAYKAVQGVLAWPDVQSLPFVPDLAVLCTNAKRNLELLEALGKKGCKTCIILSSPPEQQPELLAYASRYQMRILGPNSLGLLAPWQGLNASFSPVPIRKGKLAFISQSAAVSNTILDWAQQREMGFSYFIALGDSLDIDVDELLDYLEELNKQHFLLVEYGIESTNDQTLIRINRGHTFAETVDAIERTASRGILTGGHVILGLPGESPEEIVSQAGTLSRLPLTTLKLHQLQLIRGTRMAYEYYKNPEEFHLFGVDEYIDLVIDYVEHLRPDIVLERFISQSPKKLLIAPDWGLKNYEFTARVQKRMQERGSYQGKLYKD